jgi:hypothetical protein
MLSHLRRGQFNLLIRKPKFAHSLDALRSSYRQCLLLLQIIFTQVADGNQLQKSIMARLPTALSSLFGRYFGRKQCPCVMLYKCPMGWLESILPTHCLSSSLGMLKPCASFQVSVLADSCLFWCSTPPSPNSQTPNSSFSVESFLQLLDKLDPLVSGKGLGSLDGSTDGAVDDQLGEDTDGSGHTEEDGVVAGLGKTVVLEEDSGVSIDVGVGVLGLAVLSQDTRGNLVNLADELEHGVLGEVLCSIVSFSTFAQSIEDLGLVNVP